MERCGSSRLYGIMHSLLYIDAQARRFCPYLLDCRRESMSAQGWQSIIVVLANGAAVLAVLVGLALWSKTQDDKQVGQ